jgi:predicted metal-dependent hydrolase
MEEIKYILVFSKRKTISIIVSPTRGVTVRAPYRTSLKVIEKYIGEKSDWIRKHLESHSKLTRINNNKEYTEGELNLFMGREVHLKLTRSAKPFVRQYDNILEAGLPEPENKNKVRAAVDKWYFMKAQENINEEMKVILLKYKNYNFSPSAVKVKRLRSRWGSCSSKGVITISSELIKLDLKFTEYVIIHELCHLKSHNHGKNFYGLLGELFPDYKSVRKELRKFITR